MTRNITIKAEQTTNKLSAVSLIYVPAVALGLIMSGIVVQVLLPRLSLICAAAVLTGLLLHVPLFICFVKEERRKGKKWKAYKEQSLKERRIKEQRHLAFMSILKDIRKEIESLKED